MAAMTAMAPGLKAQGPEFDLLIRNGHVIDPRNTIDAVMDVAIAGGKIARVAASIDPPASARRVVDATGLYVVPGLIDMLARVLRHGEGRYLSNSDTAVPPDSHSFRSG